MNRFLATTQEDRRAMLQTIGAESIEDLFQEVPASLCSHELRALPPAKPESLLWREMQKRARQNESADSATCFLGAGCYDHFIPSVVDHMISRQEFYTAYTPYQPEISQGLLQAMFEYQTMMLELCGLDVANASLYDGATAVAEAVLMACQATRKGAIVCPDNVHPHSREVLQTYARTGRYQLQTMAAPEGIITPDELEKALDENVAALVVQNPNFFGLLENLPQLAEILHARKAYLIVCADPVALALLEAPGNQGADLVVGDGQALGNPMQFGGPSLGFLAAGKKDLRRMPGRIVGETEDRQKKRGYVLTVQTREQHIRREKATSNICSNQALNALAAAVHLATMGPEGLKDAAHQSVAKAHYAFEALTASDCFEPCFEAPFFKEFAVRCKQPVSKINEQLLGEGILGGLDLGTFMGRDGEWLLAVTEQRTKDEIDHFVKKAVQACS